MLDKRHTIRVKGMCCGALIAGLLLAYPAGSEAREIYRQLEPQGTPPAQGSTAARNDSAQLSFAGVERGVISFDLQRLPTSATDKSGAVPFRFLDADGKVLLLLRVACNFEPEPARAALHWIGKDPEFARNSLGLWSPTLLLDQAIQPGQTVHLDLTWDDESREYGFFVDGRAIETRPGTYDTTRKIYDRDRREVINAQATGQGEAPVFASLPFGHFLSKVRTIVVGERTFSVSRRKPGRGPEGVVYDTVVSHLVVDVDVSAVPLRKADAQGHNVQELAARHSSKGIRLTWQPPAVRGINQGYYVYRRPAVGDAPFEKLTARRVYEATYTDADAVPGESYRYSVTAVYGNGLGGAVESQLPPEVTFAGGAFAVASVAAEKPLYGSGQEVAVTLRGPRDSTATFTVERLTQTPVAMQEIDDGVYLGSITVPEGVNLAAAALTGTLTDPATGESATLIGAPVTIDGIAPDAAPRILASVPWAGEIELSWEPSPSADVAEYRVYRGEGADPVTTGIPYETTRELTLTDTAVIPGIEYRYAVVPVDAAGNAGAASDVASATAVPGDGPQVSGVTVEPFGRPARPGQVLTVSLTGQSGGTATVDLGTLATGLPLTEAGSTGVYTAAYTVPDTAVAETKSTHRLIAHLTDTFGATTQAGPELVIVGQDALNDQTPPVIASASHDAFQVAGFSGALVAGDRVTVTLEGEPYGYASFAVSGVTEGVALAETPEGSGTYTGSYTVDWDDEGTAAALTATLADEGGNTTSTAVGQPLTFDTRVRLSVTARDTLLPADRESQTRLVVKAEDANGGKVAGHELSLMLGTTEEYTGVVGGGDVEGKRASKDDLDDLEVKWGGTTDFGGEVAATYTAGFAAKTALIVVKDLTTGDVGAGWLNTYVASTISITLTPVAGRAARGVADQATLTLTADPTWLTADGRSKSRLTATLKDFSGNPLAGKRISFALAGDNGRLKVLDSATDSRGVAQAEYRAGTVIGTVMVTAASTDYAVTGSVQITLKSDAPAKIDLVADALTLPADGNSTATIAFRVTDIHDNPNDAVPVTLTLLDGSGDLSASALLTDRNGQGTITFTAGRSAGPAVIEARHTSRAPTQDELRRIHGTVFVPRLLERQERERIKVAEWLAEPGDEVVKGQPLVELEMRGATWTLSAPAAGVFIREVKHRRDRVELADTLGYVEIDPEVWTTEYPER